MKHLKSYGFPINISTENKMTLLTLPTTGDLAGKTKKELNEMLETKYSPSDLKTTSKNDVITFVRAELAMKLEQGTDLKDPKVSCEVSDLKKAVKVVPDEKDIFDKEGHYGGEPLGQGDANRKRLLKAEEAEQEKPEKKKREKLDYASVFTKIVSNIKSEVFNIDPVNSNSNVLSVKTGLKGTNYNICLHPKEHRVEITSSSDEIRPIFVYINRDARKVNKDIYFESPTNRKMFKIKLTIPATDNIEEDAIDIASKADDFLKVIEPIVQQQIANEISKNK